MTGPVSLPAKYLVHCGPLLTTNSSLEQQNHRRKTLCLMDKKIRIGFRRRIRYNLQTLWVH